MSKYAEKLQRHAALPPGVKLAYPKIARKSKPRVCTKCGGKLSKPKGHGFVSPPGTAIYCGKCGKVP